LGDAVPTDIAHTHFSSLTVKNAVVDWWRDSAAGKRPDVDPKSPTLPLVCYLHRGGARLYRSLSGLGSMHRRGYRDAMHAASLRETLAAAMLVEAGGSSGPPTHHTHTTHHSACIIVTAST
jgi:putative N6-adenine-specific DNA methylase